MSDINIVLENRDDIHVAVEEKDINVEVPAGKDGRALHPRGEWSASAAYAYLDLVSYEGSSYVATKAVPAGTLPTDTSYWMLSAEKGEPGTPEWGAITGDLSDQTDLQEALDDKATVITETASGSVVSFSDGSAAPVKALTVGIEPVQAGTGDPSPENVRPISGWSEAKIWRTNGINILPYTAITKSNNVNSLTVTPTSDGFVIAFTSSSPVAYRGGNFYRYDSLASILTPGKSYVLSFTASGVTSQMAVGLRRIDNNSFIKSIYFSEDGDYTFPISYADAEIGYLSFINNTAARYNVTYSNVILTECQSVTIDLGEERFGAMLDILMGEMTVTDGNIASYDGETLPSTWISDRDVYAPGTTPTTGAQVVYKLASPQTVQLTPSQMQTLLGENHIWADTGDVSVEYRVDTKLYIDEVASATAKVTRQMIADSATADGKAPKSLATGDLIIVGDELRKATANIGNGSAITASNSTIATLADVIKALQ